jgi:ferredoxin/flavodoxin---NADP+ reductase
MNNTPQAKSSFLHSEVPKLVPETYDIIIAGGGPVGLFAAYYAGLRDMKTKLIDRRHELGGQLTAIYPEKFVYDIPGIPSIRGKELFLNLEKQFQPYNIPVACNEEVTFISKNRNNILRIESRKIAENKDGKKESFCVVHHAKTVLLCLGMGAHIPRRLDVPNIREFEGKGVHYGVHSLNDFRGKRVLVLGGGDSALDLALTVVDECKDLVLAHRSDRFNAHEETTKKLYASNAEIKTFHELVGLKGNQVLEGATLKDTRTGELLELSIDVVIVAVGLIFNLQGVKEWGVELNNNAIVVNDDRQSSVEGVYAAGDIATYASKMKLIGTGTAEAMNAIHHAKHYIQEKFPYL